MLPCWKWNGWFTSFCLMLEFFVYEFEKFSIFFHWNQIDKSVVELQQFSKDKWMVLLIWLRSNLNWTCVRFLSDWIGIKGTIFNCFENLINRSPASRHGTVLIFIQKAGMAQCLFLCCGICCINGFNGGVMKLDFMPVFMIVLGNVFMFHCY